MVKKSLILSLFMSLIVALPLMAKEMTIVVVDVNMILNESKEGSEAKAKIEGRFEELKVKITEKQDELKEMKDELDKKKIILGKEKLKEKEIELQDKMVGFQRFVKESQKEMRDKETAYTTVILDKIKVIINREVEANKYDLVIDKSAGVFYAEKSMDISENILKILNEEYESGKGKN